MAKKPAANDYLLGRNITEQARGKAKDTVVMSVRLAVEEFLRLNAVAEAEGKTTAQVAREGIRARIKENRDMPANRISLSIGTLDGGAVSLGVPWQATRNGSAIEETQVSYGPVP